jgi:hypothetical protein
VIEIAWAIVFWGALWAWLHPKMSWDAGPFVGALALGVLVILTALHVYARLAPEAL